MKFLLVINTPSDHKMQGNFVQYYPGKNMFYGSENTILSYNAELKWL
jgi:hypothetical protein